MPNWLFFPFLFYCVCFSFWLHFFGWLFETVNYHAPLNSCPISCPCINWTSVLMGLKLSSYLENFQPVIRTFFSVFSFFHFVWDSIYIYFSILKVVSNLCDAQLIVSQTFHSYFPCLYLTYSLFFSFMTLKIIILGSILMSFPANYVIYILTVFLLIDFPLILDIFLLLYTLEIFFFLNFFIYLN